VKGDVTQVLATLPLFEGLSSDTLKALATSMRERSLASGEMLCGRGDSADRMFVIVGGRLRVSVATAQGRELSMRIASAGEMIGEIGVFDGLPRTADMTAIAPTRVASMEAETFFSALQQHPQIARNALKLLCGRLRDTTAQLEAIALYPIEQRLARLFLIATRDVEGAPRRGAALKLDLSQTEIAQLLGATRSKINVAFGKLEKSGALRRASDRYLYDRELLQRLADAGHVLEA
jgi:CRP-like cAMP-binding protein